MIPGAAARRGPPGPRRLRFLLPGALLLLAAAARADRFDALRAEAGRRGLSGVVRILDRPAPDLRAGIRIARRAARRLRREPGFDTGDLLGPPVRTVPFFALQAEAVALAGDLLVLTNEQGDVYAAGGFLDRE